MMKRRSSVLIIALLLLLVGSSIYIYKSKSRLTTVDEDSRNFRFKDTASVTRIFIADKEGNQASIERTKKGWVVNGKYVCRSEAILNLLEVVRNVEVKAPVPKETKENVIKFLASGALKVEIYCGDNLVKQYYVGHETLDSEASYMLLRDIESNKNYADPYACFIPGFNGYLRPRYIAKENEWRDRLVLNYIPPQLKQIKVVHASTSQDSSFTIDILNTTTFKLKNLAGREVNFDLDKMKQYLIYFQNLSYEGLITGKNKRLQDSLNLSQPFCTISIKTVEEKTEVFKFYRKQFAGNINPEIGVKYDFDPDRLYLNFGNGKEWALIQYFVFGKLLVNTGYLLPNGSVKK